MSDEYQNIQNREVIENDIIDFLNKFEKNKYDLSIVRGIYLYGEHGTGKSEFVKNILTRNGFDIIL